MSDKYPPMLRSQILLISTKFFWRLSRSFDQGWIRLVGIDLRYKIFSKTTSERVELQDLACQLNPNRLKIQCFITSLQVKLRFLRLCNMLHHPVKAQFIEAHMFHLVENNFSGMIQYLPPQTMIALLASFSKKNPHQTDSSRRPPFFMNFLGVSQTQIRQLCFCIR